MKSSYTQNREISWLRFNERVLDEANDNSVLLLERLKFLNIFTDNLTEFFMVRIGSLTDLSIYKKDFRENKTDLTAKQQIEAVLEMLPKMYKKRTETYNSVLSILDTIGLSQKSFVNLTLQEKNFLKNFFYKDLFPFLSPQIIDSSHPFPFLENDTLYIFVSLKFKKKKFFGILPIRSDFPLFLVLNSTEKFSYILIEEILLNFVTDIFIDYKVEDSTIIRVTRNFDFTERSDIRDEFENYKDYMKAIIKRRTRQQAVRLESTLPISLSSKKFLLTNLKLDKKSFFITNTPIKLNYVYELEKSIPTALQHQICNANLFPNELKIKEGAKIAWLKNNDCLFFYPYDDFNFFLSLIKEAANDKNVFSIKVTIYRLAKNSKLVQYLANASENGKEVTVFMELKARFDEERNINYSEILYNSGCNIIFGFEKFKMHSKVCLISYKEKNTIKHIAQIGTGNYNEVTAKQYCDISLITSNPNITLDIVDFFKNMSIGNIQSQYSSILCSPFTMKQKLLYYMELERLKRSEGFIFFKVNSITDKEIIDKLVECSCFGVTVHLIVRGICCLLPNIKGFTENIQIKSIIGRFLEHARIFIFGKDKNAQYFIASSDLMTRNMERRIEIATPILDKTCKELLKTYCLNQWHDTKKVRILQNTGELSKAPLKKNEEPFSSQEYYLQKTFENQNTQKSFKSFFKKIIKAK